MGYTPSKYRDRFASADPDAGAEGGMKIQWGGVHRIEVSLVKIKESDKYSNNWFIVEFKVLDSSANKTQVGEIYSWVHNMDEKWYGMPRLKQFMAACMGYCKGDENAKTAVDWSDVEEATSEEQPLKGLVLDLVTTPKTTANEREVIDHQWWPEGEYTEGAEEGDDPKDRE